MINVLSICNAHLLFSIIPSIRPTDDIWPLHLLDLSDDNHVSASYGIYLYQPTADIYLFMLKIAHPSHSNQHNTLHCIFDRKLDVTYKLLKHSPVILKFYLDNFVMPLVLENHGEKIAASGQDLGGDMLFSRRVGFR